MFWTFDKSWNSLSFQITQKNSARCVAQHHQLRPAPIRRWHHPPWQHERTLIWQPNPPENPRRPSGPSRLFTVAWVGGGEEGVDEGRDHAGVQAQLGRDACGARTAANQPPPVGRPRGRGCYEKAWWGAWLDLSREQLLMEKIVGEKLDESQKCQKNFWTPA